MDNQFGERDNLTFSLDLTGKKSAADIGRVIIPPGRFHTVVERILAAERGGLPTFRFHFRIKAGTVPGYENKEFTDDIFNTDTNRERILFIAHRLGLISKDDYGKKTSRSWHAAVNKQVVVEVEENNYTDKQGNAQRGHRLTWGGIWDVTDPEVADVPKDPDSLALAGIVLATPPRPAVPVGGAGSRQDNYQQLSRDRLSPPPGQGLIEDV
jgi:hypothetical protein